MNVEESRKVTEENWITTEEFIKMLEKESETNMEFSPDFINKLKSLDDKVSKYRQMFDILANKKIGGQI